MIVKINFEKIQKALIEEGFTTRFNTTAFCEFWLTDDHHAYGIRVWKGGEVRASINGNAINKDFDASECEIEKKIVKWFLSLQG